MPKITWKAADKDDILTADDIDGAEEGFKAYTGEIAPGGVYRFKFVRAKFEEFGTGNQGFNNLMRLDGSWKPEHAQYDGCPLWDKVIMTKKAASFAKAFAAALGVSAADLVHKVVTDKDGYVTKIGSKDIKEGMLLYVAVRRGHYNDEPRLECAGTGYQVVESSNGAAEDPWAEPTAEKGKKPKGEKGKSKNKDGDPPF